MASPVHFRSQKTNNLQKDSGLHAALSGLTMAGLSSGQVFGFSVNPRTIEKHKRELADKHTDFVFVFCVWRTSPTKAKAIPFIFVYYSSLSRMDSCKRQSGT